MQPMQQPMQPMPPYQTMPPAPPQKPGGLIALGVLVIIAGALGLIWSLLIFAASGIASNFNASAGATGSLLGILSLVLAGLDIAVGVGFLTGSSWAWTTGVVSQGASVLLDLYFLIHSWPVEILSIALAVVTIWYLFTPPAQRALGRPA